MGARRVMANSATTSAMGTRAPRSGVGATPLWAAPAAEPTSPRGGEARSGHRDGDAGAGVKAGRRAGGVLRPDADVHRGDRSSGGVPVVGRGVGVGLDELPAS